MTLENKAHRVFKGQKVIKVFKESKDQKAILVLPVQHLLMICLLQNN